MTLVFSRLIQDFTSFGVAVRDYDNVIHSGNATAISIAQQNLDSVASEFRKHAALDSSYLCYIGILFVSCKV